MSAASSGSSVTSGVISVPTSPACMIISLPPVVSWVARVIGLLEPHHAPAPLCGQERPLRIGGDPNLTPNSASQGAA